MFFAKALLVASVALAASAMVTPHARNVDHHAIAARLASPEADASPAAVRVTPRKRAVKRCAPRQASTSVNTTAHATSAAAPPPVNNVGAEPPTTHAPPPHTTTAAPPPPPKNVAPPPPKNVAPPPPPPPPPKNTSPPAKPPTTPSKPSSPPPPASNGQVFSGDGTFYATGLGACGIVNSDSDMIAAIGHDAFDHYPGYNGGNPNNNPICNKWVTAHYGGNSVRVQLVDRCGGCDIATSLDFSPAAFKKLADPAVGRIHGVTWSYDN